MTWLTEDPTLILVAGLLVEALLAVALIRSGRGIIILPMVGVAVLVAAGVGLEWFIVTEREEVVDSLDATAAAIESNDIEQVLDYIAPDASNLRAEAQHRLPEVIVNSVKFRNIRVKVDPVADPPTAEVRMLLHVTGRDRGGTVPYDDFLQPVVITLRRDGDRWLIDGYREGSRDDVLN